MPFISSKRLANMEKLLLELRERLDSLGNPAEGNDARNGTPADSRIEITIQTLHVQEVKLEELAFRLDNIAIDDLSGSFNLGNNFMGKQDPTVKAKKDSKPAGQTLASIAQPANRRLSTNNKPVQAGGPSDMPGLTRSDKGYRMTYDHLNRPHPNV